jgi:hypothetical protein
VAPPERVWEAIYAPDTLSVALPEDVLCGGRVPGAPEQQVGELHYQITRDADGKLSPSFSVVTELLPGHVGAGTRCSRHSEDDVRFENAWRAFSANWSTDCESGLLPASNIAT